MNWLSFGAPINRPINRLILLRSYSCLRGALRRRFAAPHNALRFARRAAPATRGEAECSNSLSAVTGRQDNATVDPSSPRGLGLHMAARPCVVDALRHGSSPRAAQMGVRWRPQICRLEPLYTCWWFFESCLCAMLLCCCTEGIANGNACGILLNVNNTAPLWNHLGRAHPALYAQLRPPAV